MRILPHPISNVRQGEPLFKHDCSHIMTYIVESHRIPSHSFESCYICPICKKRRIWLTIFFNKHISNRPAGEISVETPIGLSSGAGKTQQAHPCINYCETLYPTVQSGSTQEMERDHPIGSARAAPPTAPFFLKNRSSAAAGS